MGFARWAVLVCLFPLFHVIRSAATDWPPITPEELSMTSVPEQPGAPAVILYREQTDNDINSYHHVFVRMKILREAGRDIADVPILYSRRWFTVGDISGRTVHSDGSAVPFAVKPFDRTLARGRGFHVSITTFTLPDVQVGSIIDYQYDLRVGSFSGVYLYLSDPEWIIQQSLFQRKAVFNYTPLPDSRLDHLMLRRNGASFRGVAWASYLPTGQPQPQVHSVLSHVMSADVDPNRPSEYIDMQVTNIPPVLDEAYMPPVDLLRWRVRFYYVTEVKKEDFWKSQGKFWNQDTNEFVGHDSGVREAVSQTVSPSDTPEQKVRKIYAFVAKMENWDYIPERTEREQKTLDIRKTENAGDVLQHKGGRHDDLNRLFVSMVHAAGIPAYLIWVPDRSQQLFDDNFLSTRQFDAEVAIVQLDGKEMFLDSGSKFCPFGMIDWRYSGSRGLRQTAQGPRLGDTPFSNYNQSIVTRGANLELASDGSAGGNVTLTFMGLQAMSRRQEGGKTDTEGRKKLLEDELRKLLPGNSEISLTGQPDWEGSETPLVAQFKVRIPLAVSAGKRWMVSQHLFQVSETAKFSGRQRLQAIYFDYPWHEVDETHIILPAGMETESLAPDASLRLDYALYKTQHTQEGPNKIFSRRELVMASSGIPATSYKDVKTFFDGVKGDDDQTALVKVSQNVATAK